MKYELAKELKDAGFPQQHPVNHHLGGTFITDDEDITYHESGIEGECYIPTLSELIEACGEEFKQLVKVGSRGWLARSTRVSELAPEGDYTISQTSAEEAVARLWLALNKVQ